MDQHNPLRANSKRTSGGHLPISGGESLLDPDVADRRARRPHLVRDRAESEALILQLPHPLQRRLLLGYQDKFARIANLPTEGWLAPEIPPALTLIPLHLRDALTGSVTL